MRVSLLLIAAVAIAAALPVAFAADWAVIVAGSNTFDNYRHQADALHAYQIVKKNGIPVSQQTNTTERPDQHAGIMRIMLSYR